jgi:hypothetical protein
VTPPHASCEHNHDRRTSVPPGASEACRHTLRSFCGRDLGLHTHSVQCPSPSSLADLRQLIMVKRLRVDGSAERVDDARAAHTVRCPIKVVTHGRLRLSAPTRSLLSGCLRRSLTTLVGQVSLYASNESAVLIGTAATRRNAVSRTQGASTLVRGGSS